MSNVIDLHSHKQELDAIPSASQLANRWRRIGNQIRGRVSSLLASSHGNKNLKPGTAERLRQEILERCSKLEKEKKMYEQDTELFHEIIKTLNRQEGLWRNRKKKGEYEPYNNPAILKLFSIGNSPDEYRYVSTMLEVFGVNRDVLDSIVIPQLFDKYYR